MFVSCTRTPCFYNYITIKRQERMTASERLAPKLATAKRVGRRDRDGVQGGGGRGCTIIIGIYGGPFWSKS